MCCILFAANQVTHLTLTHIHSNTVHVVATLIRQCPLITTIQFQATEVLKIKTIFEALATLQILKSFIVQDVEIVRASFLPFLGHCLRSENPAPLTCISFKNMKGLGNAILTSLSYVQGLETFVLEDCEWITTECLSYIFRNFQKTCRLRAPELSGFKKFGDHSLKLLVRLRGLRRLKMTGAGTLTNEGIGTFMASTEYSLKRTDSLTAAETAAQRYASITTKMKAVRSQWNQLY